jgi:hypothetical protein
MTFHIGLNKLFRLVLSVSSENGINKLTRCVVEIRASSRTSVSRRDTRSLL